MNPSMAPAAARASMASAASAGVPMTLQCKGVSTSLASARSWASPRVAARTRLSPGRKRMPPASRPAATAASRRAVRCSRAASSSGVAPKTASATDPAKAIPDGDAPACSRGNRPAGWAGSAIGPAIWKCSPSKSMDRTRVASAKTPEARSATKASAGNESQRLVTTLTNSAARAYRSAEPGGLARP